MSKLDFDPKTLNSGYLINQFTNKLMAIRREFDVKTKDLITILVLAGVLILLNWLFPTVDSGRKNTGPLPNVIQGKTRIVDGDSLYVDAFEVRLVGIDAPEGRQMCQRNGRDWPCGRKSADGLRALIGRERVKCEVEKRDKHSRLLAVCYAGRTNLNLSQVKNGWAVSYGRYRADERSARQKKRGIWSGTFMRPKDWRDRNM